MADQAGFSSLEFRHKKRRTRREEFLAQMDALIPWKKLLEALASVQPAGKRGRPPIPLERMLRLYFVQQWYALSDEGLEDAVTDSQALRGFVGIDLMNESVPDSTTMTRFRERLNAHRGAETILRTINTELKEKGLLLREGTLVDATIIAAPSSTKNKAKARDPEMHQTRKGNQWHFGMKSHIGVDRDSGLVHSVHATAANESDIAQATKLLHGQEQSIHGDAGYVGLTKREDYQAWDEERREQGGGRLKLRIGRRIGSVRDLPEGARKERLRAVEKAKASQRAFVEHPFHILKNLFRYRKVRYRGLAKNHSQQVSLYALANLVIAGRALKPV